MTLHRTSVALALLCLQAVSASAQPDDEARRVPPDAAAVKLSFAPIVKRTAPAVVNVYSKRVVRAQVDPFWNLFAAGVPRERVEQSLGSGSIVRPDGIVLTNHHNIAGAQEIRVVTSDRREWAATVLLDDPHADLAVLKIDAKGERLPTIAIDARSAPEVGDLVLAIGDPFGVGQTVTNGIVSALARSGVGGNDYAFFIQTDAAINPGNSGGPLVDMNGDMIGVNTAIVSSSGASAGIGFAIPAAIAQQAVEAAVSGEHEVVRPWLGVKTQVLTGEMAASFGLAAPQGVVVTDVWPGGAAARAGLARGDVIVSVDGEAVNDDGGLTYRVATHPVGDELTLGVRRNGQPHTVRVTAARAPETPAPAERTIAGRNPLAGLTVINISPAEALRHGVDAFVADGVLVTAVAPGYGQAIGVRAGDIIREVNGRKITTTADLEAAVAISASTWSLAIERNGQIIRARFTG